MLSLSARSAVRRGTMAHLSRSVAVGKRHSSSEHGNDPTVIEVEKGRNMRKEQHKTSTTIKNAPGWNQYLASASEAAIKADRSDHSPEELTSETLKHIKARHHADEALNGEERIDAYEASYERDETSGPLKHSAAKETTERETYKEKVVRK